MTYTRVREEFEVRGRDLLRKIKDIVRQGNVTRIIVKDKKGDTFVEIPATVGALGVLLIPFLTILGALTALIADFRIVVERAEPKGTNMNRSRLTRV